MLIYTRINSHIQLLEDRVSDLLKSLRDRSERVETFVQVNDCNADQFGKLQNSMLQKRHEFLFVKFLDYLDRLLKRLS